MEPADDILLGDTMGELFLLLGMASVVFIGGSLVERGGHNALEAAAWGKPVVCGPSMFNFEEISRLLIEAGALLQLNDSMQLGACLQQLLDDPSRCAAMGRAGQQVVAANRGALDRVLELVAEAL